MRKRIIIKIEHKNEIFLKWYWSQKTKTMIMIINNSKYNNNNNNQTHTYRKNEKIRMQGEIKWNDKIWYNKIKYKKN